MEIQTKTLRDPDRRYRFWKRRGAIVPSIVNEHDDIIINSIQKRNSLFGHMGFVPQEVRKKYHSHEPLCLVSLGSDAKIDKAWYLREGFIGRATGPESILPCQESSMEPIHARVHVEDDMYYVQDNNSANGSYLCLKTMKRNRRQRDGYRLRVDDQFTVGWFGQITVKSIQTESKKNATTGAGLFRACSINTLDLRNNPPSGTTNSPAQEKFYSARASEVESSPLAQLKRRATAGTSTSSSLLAIDTTATSTPPPQQQQQQQRPDDDPLASPPGSPSSSQPQVPATSTSTTSGAAEAPVETPTPTTTTATEAPTQTPISTSTPVALADPASPSNVNGSASTTTTGTAAMDPTNPTTTLPSMSATTDPDPASPSTKTKSNDKPKRKVHFGNASVSPEEPWDKAANDYVRPNIKNARFWYHEKEPVNLVLGIKTSDKIDERILTLGKKGVYIIGSSPKCDVQVCGEGIHPVHARIVFDGFFFVLQDLSFEPSVRRRTRVLMNKPTQVERSDILLFGECCYIVEDEKHAFPYKHRHATSLPDTHFALRSHIYRFSKRKKRCRMRYAPVVFILSNKEELEVGRNPTLNGYFRTTSLCSIHFTIEARHGVCYLTPHYGGLNQGVYLLVGRNPFLHLDDQPQDPVRVTSKALLLQENMVFRLGNSEFEVCCIKRSAPNMAMNESYSNMMASVGGEAEEGGDPVIPPPSIRENATANTTGDAKMKSTVSQSLSNGRKSTANTSADFGRSQNSFREDAQAIATAKRSSINNPSAGRSDRSFRQYLHRQKQREKAIRSEFARILGDLPWIRQLALALDVLETLVAHASKVELQDGDIVYNQGDPASFFFVLLTGEVSLNFFASTSSASASLAATVMQSARANSSLPSEGTLANGAASCNVDANGTTTTATPAGGNETACSSESDSAQATGDPTGTGTLLPKVCPDPRTTNNTRTTSRSNTYRPGAVALASPTGSSNQLPINQTGSSSNNINNNNVNLLTPLPGNIMPLHTEKVPAGSYFGEVIFVHDRREEIYYGEMARATSKCTLLVFNREDFFGYCAPYLNVLLPQFEYEQFKPFLYHLRKLKRFEYLNYDELRVLAGHAQVLEYGPNEIICNDPANHTEDSLLFIVDGTIESLRKSMPIEYSPYEMLTLTTSSTSSINTTIPPASMVTCATRTSSSTVINTLNFENGSRSPTPTATLPQVDVSCASLSGATSPNGTTQAALPTIMPAVPGAMRRSGNGSASLGLPVNENFTRNNSGVGPTVNDTSTTRKFDSGVVASSKVRAIKLLVCDIEKCMDSFINELFVTPTGYSPYEDRKLQFAAAAGSRATGLNTTNNDANANANANTNTSTETTQPTDLRSRRNLTKQNSFARRQSMSQRSLLLTAKEQAKETGSQLRFESNKDDYANMSDDDGNGSFEDANDDGSDSGNGQKWRRKKKNPELLEQTIAAVLSNEEMPNALVLYVLSGANRGDIHVVRNVCTIGNSIDENGEYPNGGWGLNDIELNDQYVSRQHAFLEHRDGKYWLYDEWSEWGTFVRLDEENQNALEITAGDTFVAGEIEFTCMMTLAKNEKSKMCVLQ